MRNENDTDRPAAPSRVTPLRNLRGYRIADGAPDVPGEINPDYEQSLRRWFDPSFTPSPERDLYEHPIYDQERFYRRRRAAAQRMR